MLPISKSNNISCYFKLRLTRKKRLFVITPLLNIKKKLIFLCTIFYVFTFYIYNYILTNFQLKTNSKMSNKFVPNRHICTLLFFFFLNKTYVRYLSYY